MGSWSTWRKPTSSPVSALTTAHPPACQPLAVLFRDVHVLDDGVDFPGIRSIENQVFWKMRQKKINLIAT